MPEELLSPVLPDVLPDVLPELESLGLIEAQTPDALVLPDPEADPPASQGIPSS